MKGLMLFFMSLIMLLTGCGNEPETTEAESTTEETTESLRPDELVKENYNYFQYDTLMREPDKVKSQQVHIMSAHVFQVLEDYEEGFNMYLANLGSSTDTVALAISKDFMETRILEDDELTIYGIVGNPYTYETSSGAQKEVPLIFIDYYEILE